MLRDFRLSCDELDQAIFATFIWGYSQGRIYGGNEGEGDRPLPSTFAPPSLNSCWPKIETPAWVATPCRSKEHLEQAFFSV